MTDIRESLKKWSEKLSVPVEELEKDLNNLINEENTLHKDLPEDVRKTRAIQRLSLTFKRQLRSPAVGFEGIVIGMTNANDTSTTARNKAKDLFKKDQQQAINSGLTDESGVPLDNRKEYKTGRLNPNYGKPLPEHSYMRTIYGIGIKSSVPGDKPKFFKMTANGDYALNLNLTMFKPVRFRALDKTPIEEAGKSYLLNASSTYTIFEVDEKLKVPRADELLKKYFANLIIGIENLEQWHNTNKENFDRLVVVEGDVSLLNLDSSSGRANKMMAIEKPNATLDDFDNNSGITCWVPPHVNIDFGEQSKVLVVASTSQGKKKDEAGNITEELGNVNLNVFGVYAIPEFRINREVKPVTEENTDFSVPEVIKPEIKQANSAPATDW